MTIRSRLRGWLARPDDRPGTLQLAAAAPGAMGAEGYQSGVERKTSRAQATSSVVQIQRSDFTSLTSASGLTVATLVGALNDANTGNIRPLVELLEEMLEKDSHLGGIVQARKLAVAGADWELLPAADDADERIVPFCDAALRGIPSLEDRLLDLLDALVQPLSVCEILWRYQGGSVLPAALSWIHPKRFMWNTIYEGVTGLDLGELRLISDSNPTPGERLWSDKFIIHQTRSHSGWPCRSGLGRALAILYLYKIYSVKDWATFLELWAQPIRWAELAPTASPDSDRSALEDALADIGSDAIAIVSAGTKLNLLMPSGTGAQASYQPLLDFLDTQASKLVLGHAGAADAVPGNLGGVDNAAAALRGDLRVADAKALGTTLRRDLLTPLVRWEFGAEAAEKWTPYFHFRVEAGEDLKAHAERVKLLCEAGLKIPAAWVRDVQGVPEPEDDEELLEAPAAPSPFGAPFGGPPAGPPAGPGPDGGGSGGEPPGGQDEATAPTGEDKGEEPEEEAALKASAPPRRAILRADDDDLIYQAGPLLSAKQAEQLIRASLRKATPLWRSWLAPLKTRLAAAQSYAEMQQILSEPGLLDPDQIAEIVHQSKLMGQLVGRVQVANEAGVALAKVGEGIEPLPPEQAIEWLGERLDLPYSTFREADDRTKALGFSVAGLEQENVLAQVRAHIGTALREGTGFDTFRGNLRDLYASIGVSERSPWHTETVFRTNVGSSIAAGRWKEMADPVVRSIRPYLQYRTVGDHAVRPTHAAMNGKVYRADDPIWSTWAPPAGFNCRCVLITLNQRGLDARGLTVSTEAPTLDGQPVEPDEGFASNPGLTE